MEKASVKQLDSQGQTTYARESQVSGDSLDLISRAPPGEEIVTGVTPRSRVRPAL